MRPVSLQIWGLRRSRGSLHSMNYPARRCRSMCQRVSPRSTRPRRCPARMLASWSWSLEPRPASAKRVKAVWGSPFSSRCLQSTRLRQSSLIEMLIISANNRSQQPSPRHIRYLTHNGPSLRKYPTARSSQPTLRTASSTCCPHSSPFSSFINQLTRQQVCSLLSWQRSTSLALAYFDSSRARCISRCRVSSPSSSRMRSLAPPSLRTPPTKASLLTRSSSRFISWFTFSWIYTIYLSLISSQRRRSDSRSNYLHSRWHCSSCLRDTASSSLRNSPVPASSSLLADYSLAFVLLNSLFSSRFYLSAYSSEPLSLPAYFLSSNKPICQADRLNSQRVSRLTSLLGVRKNPAPTSGLYSPLFLGLSTALSSAPPNSPFMLKVPLGLGRAGGSTRLESEMSQPRLYCLLRLRFFSYMNLSLSISLCLSLQPGEVDRSVAAEWGWSVVGFWREKGAGSLLLIYQRISSSIARYRQLYFCSIRHSPHHQLVAAVLQLFESAVRAKRFELRLEPETKVQRADEDLAVRAAALAAVNEFIGEDLVADVEVRADWFPAQGIDIRPRKSFHLMLLKMAVKSVKALGGRGSGRGCDVVVVFELPVAPGVEMLLSKACDPLYLLYCGLAVRECPELGQESGDLQALSVENLASYLILVEKLAEPRVHRLAHLIYEGTVNVVRKSLPVLAVVSLDQPLEPAIQEVEGGRLEEYDRILVNFPYAFCDLLVKLKQVLVVSCAGRDKVDGMPVEVGAGGLVKELVADQILGVVEHLGHLSPGVRQVVGEVPAVCQQVLLESINVVGQVKRGKLCLCTTLPCGIALVVVVHRQAQRLGEVGPIGGPVRDAFPTELFAEQVLVGVKQDEDPILCGEVDYFLDLLDVGEVVDPGLGLYSFPGDVQADHVEAPLPEVDKVLPAQRVVGVESAGGRVEGEGFEDGVDSVEEALSAERVDEVPSRGVDLPELSLQYQKGNQHKYYDDGQCSGGDESGGGGDVVLELGGDLLGPLVVARQPVDPGLDQDEPVLRVLVLAELLEVLADVDGLLYQAVQVLGDLGGTAVLLQDPQDLLAGQQLHLGDGVLVPEGLTDLRGRLSLLGQLHDEFAHRRGGV